MRDVLLDRRGFCAALAGVAFGLSGCVDPQAVLTMEEVDDQGIADNLATGLSPTETPVVAEAVENGSATTTDVTVPFDGGRPVEHESGYYDVQTEEVGTETVQRYTVAVEPPEEDVEYDEIEFEELPEVDRDKLRPMFGVDRQGDRRVRAEGSYDADEANSSVLVPEGEYDAVRRNDSVLSLSVGGPREVEVGEYRYEVELVAESPSELADWARESYLWELEGLNAGEREIVEEAIGSGYYEGSVSDDFRSLARRFEERPAVESTDWGGNYLVDYGGATYWTDLRRPPSAV